MSKMKTIKVQIGGRDEELTARLVAELRRFSADFESAVVYSNKATAAAPPIYYLAVVDGVPITPWISYRTMVNLLLAGLLHDEQAAEEVARYEQDKSWQASYKRGEWEL